MKYPFKFVVTLGLLSLSYAEEMKLEIKPNGEFFGEIRQALDGSNKNQISEKITRAIIGATATYEKDEYRILIDVANYDSNTVKNTTKAQTMIIRNAYARVSDVIFNTSFTFGLQLTLPFIMQIRFTGDLFAVTPLQIDTKTTPGQDLGIMTSTQVSPSLFVKLFAAKGDGQLALNDKVDPKTKFGNDQRTFSAMIHNDVKSDFVWDIHGSYRPYHDYQVYSPATTLNGKIKPTSTTVYEPETMGGIFMGYVFADFKVAAQYLIMDNRGGINSPKTLVQGSEGYVSTPSIKKFSLFISEQYTTTNALDDGKTTLVAGLQYTHNKYTKTALTYNQIDYQMASLHSVSSLGVQTEFRF